MKKANPKKLEELRTRIIDSRDENKTCITICGGTGCHAYGCEKIAQNFRTEIKKQNLESKIDLRVTGCHGFCERGPIVVMQPDGIFYQRVKNEDIKEIISKTALNKEVIPRLLYKDPQTDEIIEKEKEVAFYKKQKRIIFGRNGFIDPTNIQDYIALDGYKAISQALFEMEPKEIISEVKKSGLRGRGGGGFLTGKKWEICSRQDSPEKYVICNADEG
ncbi:MAG TPA: NAD(P)H-dependent oxidoreductase subunit E, partial [Acidobacteriota bacterium]|nr:NAD(P)H-dependent oxidoreductase subunit E [Acidobacteriota bacterium]